jgi:DNA repair protein RadC
MTTNKAQKTKKKKILIREMPRVERPREKLIEKRPENLKDEELLAILLRTGTKEKSALDLAKQILRKFPKKKFQKLKYQDLIKIIRNKFCKSL